MNDDKRLVPMFAWDRANPVGEGQAGDYVRHLRKARVAVDPGHMKTGMALDFGVTSNEKEKYMPGVTVTITAESIEDLASLLLDIGGYDGIDVRVYQHPATESAPSNRSRFTDALSIRRYLTAVCKRNACDPQVEVTVEYVKMDGERSTRIIVPIRTYGGYLALTDVGKENRNRLKTFLLDGIKSVEGPTLEMDA